MILKEVVLQHITSTDQLERRSVTDEQYRHVSSVESEARNLAAQAYSSGSDGQRFAAQADQDVHSGG
jgi:hypothetical protein